MSCAPSRRRAAHMRIKSRSLRNKLSYPITPFVGDPGNPGPDVQEASRQDADGGRGTADAAWLPKVNITQPPVRAPQCSGSLTTISDLQEESMNNPTNRIFLKSARIHDWATNSYLDRIVIPVSDTETRVLELAPSIVNEPKALEKILRDAGAILPTDDAH